MKLPKMDLNLETKSPQSFLGLKVTERDKKLLVGLAILILIVLSYYLLYKPLHKVSQKLHTEKTQMDAKVKQAKLDLANESQISRDYEAALTKTNKLAESFFPRVYPYKDRYLLLLENVIYNSGAKALKIEFKDPEIGAVPQDKKPEDKKRLVLPGYPLQVLAEIINAAQPGYVPEKKQINNTNNDEAKKKTKDTDKNLPGDSVLRLPATLEIQGSYAQIKAVITNLEHLNRKIVIEGVSIQKDDQENYQKGTITLAFYAVEKVDNGADPFNAWTIQGNYGKADLFN